MNKKYLALTCLSVLLLVSACQGKYDIEKFPPVEDRYDSSKPVALDAVKPDYGAINNSFILEGNFPTDGSEIKVYFDDRKAVILSNDGRTISGLVPKQLPGRNQISLVVGNDSLAPAKIKFKYNQSKMVTLVAGAVGQNQDVNGSIAAGVVRFREPTGVGAVRGANGDNVVVAEAWGSGKLKFIDQDAGQVTTLEQNAFSGPAVTSDRERFWVIGVWGDQHSRIRFADRSEAWTTKNPGFTLAQSDYPGNIWGTTFVNDDDLNLYFMDARFNMGCLNLETGESYKLAHEAKTVGDEAPSTIIFTGNWGDRSDLIWSNYHQAFFACFENHPVVIKGVFKDGDPNSRTIVWERFCGKEGENGEVYGHRLNDARIRQPYGLCESEEGDIYVVHRYNYIITRIFGDQIERAVGTGNWSPQEPTSGPPLEVTIDHPQDMCRDSDGNFYIADGWGRTVRKLTIE